MNASSSSAAARILGVVALLSPLAFRFVMSHSRTGSNSNSNNSNSDSSSSSSSSNSSSSSSDATNKVSTNAYGRRVIILYGTQQGTARKLSATLSANIAKLYQIPVVVQDLKDYDEENLSGEDIVLLLLSTWSGGAPTESAGRFCAWLEDMSTDFRVNKDHFRKINFAVLGIGAAVYGEESFCTAAKKVSKNLLELGGVQICPTVVGDYESNLEDKFIEWKKRVILFIGTVADENFIDRKPKANRSIANNANLKTAAFVSQKDKSRSTDGSSEVKAEVSVEKECCKSGTGGATSGEGDSSCGCNDNSASASKTEEGEDDDGGGGCCAPPESDEEEEEDRINNMYVNDSDDDDDVNGGGKERTVFSGIEEGYGGGESTLVLSGAKGVADLEDLVKAGVVSAGGGNAGAGEKSIYSAGAVPREMVTKLQRKALNKEGYKIIGSHSAVKLCRWTKNQMRGRGGCYKHTCYGITSYQCMEATPSLACANKCVFCWRHHKNPVGTEWRWKTDDPAFIVHEAIELHRAMIREMKGVPGVLPERLKEGDTVRHCALSLVGEPIMYPRINEMLKELHVRDISTFLVTNAQFPERIRDCDPVTQLYVSIDAPTKDSLKAVDRPLFKDFWERYIASLGEVDKKRQRTVFRLTLIKSWNMEELDEYANLIELGRPDFIEIKAVTYCGKSDASTLTMQNVPWHAEVCAFAESLAARVSARNKTGFNYSIATEHEHSCCIVLANEEKFFVKGTWHTWIDYPKFSMLIKEYYDSGCTKSFDSVDYMAETPRWALYKSETKGFDPEEQRWRRNKNGEKVENTYKSSESGCG